MNVYRSGISGRSRTLLSRLTGRGRQLVTVGDAVDTLDLERTEAAKLLARWAEQGWLRRVRRGMYIAVPVDAEHPAQWSADPLVIATDQTLLDHRYLVSSVSSEKLEWGIRSVWQDATRIGMADPTRAIVDVLDDPSIGGGIRHCAEMLTTYVAEHERGLLLDYADRLGNAAVLKRLGHLCERLELADDGFLEECERRLSAGIALLDPSLPERGERDTRWRVRVNSRVRADDPS